MAHRPTIRHAWLLLAGAVVAGGLAAELVVDLQAAPAPLPPTTLGTWPGQTAAGTRAVGAGPLPPGLLTAATGMMAALETWRDVAFTADVHVSTVDADAAGRLGLYDAERHTLRIVGSGGGALGPMTLLHELCHALQDQHLDLGARGPARDDADAALAWRALVEGEAMLAGAELTGLSLDAHGDLARTRVLDDASAESLLLYMDGAAFVQALRDEGGWPAVTAAWSDPPTTTAEILDPNLYLEDTEFLPAHDLGPGQRAGAHALSRLLHHTEAGRADARAIARAWRGDARDAGAWVLAIAPPWDERLAALAPDALEAAGHASARAERLQPGQVRLSWAPAAH